MLLPGPCCRSQTGHLGLGWNVYPGRSFSSQQHKHRTESDTEGEICRRVLVFVGSLLHVTNRRECFAATVSTNTSRICEDLIKLSAVFVLQLCLPALMKV